MKDALGYYKLLQVPTNADFEVIKHSYRDLAKIWHPDNNHEQNATDVFQKLSVAYDVLGTPQSRLIYDLMSMVYNQNNYPDLDAIVPISDGDEGIDVEVVNVREVMSWGIGYKQNNRYIVASYKDAVKLNAKVAIVNWLIGWWHPKGFFLNIKAIAHNFKEPTSQVDTLRIMIHNMIAYAEKSQKSEAVNCGIKARSMVDEYGKKLIDEYLTLLNTQASAPKKWNKAVLKLVQCIVPLILVGGVLITNKTKFVTDSQMWNIFSKSERINYYQKVNTGYGQSVDDVVVGRVVSIPVDKSDNSKLYHMTEESKVMYGPSDNFDIIKVIPEKTTVRLTGYTPDNVWARVMIDNGESGFVYYDTIKQGIGKEIPFGSSITE